VQRESFHLRAQRPLHERLIPPIATNSTVQLTRQGAEEGAPFIARHLIRPPARAFDDFAGGKIDKLAVRQALGLE
jgi:hypothetical protein